MTTGGAAYCFGNNDFGQCGVPVGTSAPEMPKEIDCSKDLNLLDCYQVDTTSEPDYAATSTVVPALTWVSIEWAKTDKQRPYGNDATVSQYGDNLRATVAQNGLGNEALAVQTGAGNNALISQTGFNNMAIVTQH